MCHSKNLKKTIFRFCYSNEIEQINQVKSYNTYKRNQFLFQEGDKPCYLYCICRGKVKIYKQTKKGKRQIIRIAREGNFVDYSSLLSESIYPISATTLEKSVICTIPKDKIFNLFDTNKYFRREYTKSIAKELNITIKRITDIAYKPVMGRIIEALLVLSQIYKNEYNPMGVINLTREDLASFVGTVKETTIRTLRQLKEDQLIKIDHRAIIVLNSKKLACLAKLYD